jgi:hypothetical protein
MCIKAYYGTRKGGSGCRPIRSAEEAEKILRGGYNATTVRLVDKDGNIVGKRERTDQLDRGKWLWWFDHEAFKTDCQ